MPHINYNGNLLSSDTAFITASSRGLRYGDGLFETIKMLNGNIIHETGHFERLWHGMGVLQFELRKHFSKEKLTESIKSLAKKNGHEKAARIRLNVFRGEGGLYDPVNHFPNYVIETWPLQPDTATRSLNSNGLVAGIYDGVKKSCDILSNIKHNNYLPYIMAALKAKKEKWNDAIVLNQYERIADSTIANVFLVKNGVLYTPALSEGCVAGIMRKMLIQYLQQNEWQINETPITTNDIIHADEIFFTNSIYTIRWVQQIGDKIYESAVTQKIYAAFSPTIH